MRITAPDGTTSPGVLSEIGAWRPYRDHALALRREILDAIPRRSRPKLGIDVVSARAR